MTARPVTLRPGYAPLLSGSSHPIVHVIDAAGAELATVCGYSWCDGSCGFPVAVMPGPRAGEELRMYGIMVACGEVMQRWRDGLGERWSGERWEIPEALREYLMRRIWL